MTTRTLARTGLLAVIGALLIGAGMPGSALTQEEGEHILQCSCPIQWEEPWEGAGAFDEGDSLDTVVLANDGAVLLVHEIPIYDGSLDELIEDRTGSLERGNAISDLDEAFTDSTRDDALTGRVWVNDDGDTIYGFQYVQVWETNYLLSIEFVAPEADFLEEWESLEFVTLVGLPVLGQFDGADIVAAFDEGEL